MSDFRQSDSPSLQELIDNYNRELMQYHERASAASTAEDEEAQPTSAMPRPPRPEPPHTDRPPRPEPPHTDRPLRPEATEPLYPPGSGIPRPEPDEPLYPSGSGMPRPEPYEPLEPPRPHHPPRPRIGFRPAESAVTSASEVGADEAVVEILSRQEQWIRDLEQGLRDLEQGLADLERGRQEMREGQAEYEKGIAERDYWRQQAQMAQATPLPSASSFAGDDVFSAPFPNFGTTGNQNTMPGAGGMGNQTMQTPDGMGSPNILPNPDVVPNSREGRNAQSGVSIPSTGVGAGYLTVYVTTARDAFPVAGARVVVSSTLENGVTLYGTATTDDSGFTPLMPLPVGTAIASDNPYFAAPFSIYSVSVRAPGFVSQENLPAQVFSGITSTLPVNLVPVNDASGGRR
ncbi:MAG: carboxypeptidase regulatory-like domain-containing protein [Clostridia bacterium]|nr:carboxypeptidase regulatory-like domain-containing protein [Clostridia bacterium]